MTTRQQLEQQLVAAHRSGNVQAAQQAAYAIRQYDQNSLYAQVPSVNAPPPIERVPKPTFGDWLENVSYGWGKEYANQIQGLTDSVQRGVSAFAKDPLKASAAAFMSALEPALQGFTQPVQTAKDVGTGLVETGKQMYQQATSGPVGLGQTLGQLIDMPGPDLSGGKRRPTMAELDVYHGTPHTFEPEEGAPLGRFRSSKIGTGEGAQAYGYGLYLAESPGVAKEYQTSLSDFEMKVDGKPFNPDNASHRAALEVKQRGGNIALPEIINTYKSQIADLRSRGVSWADNLANAKAEELAVFEKGAVPQYSEVTKGRLYKVDLPDAKIEQMLDWDKPLSQQPKSVREALASLGDTQETISRYDESLLGALQGNAPDPGVLPKNPSGGDIVEQLQRKYGKAGASEYLRSLGIPGIKYLDAGSRDGGKGTRNFVVFPGEEQNLTILERDGVKAEVPKPDELAYHGTTKQAAATIEREGFDLTRAADGTVWFTSNPNIGEVAATGKGGIVARSVSGLKLGGWDEMDKYSTDELIAMGYDGLRLKDGDEITYQIFNPEKLKVPTKKAK